MKTITDPSREIPVTNEVDVFVVGGGPAGVGAEKVQRRGCVSVWGAVLTLHRSIADSLIRLFADSLTRFLAGGNP